MIQKFLPYSRRGDIAWYVDSSTRQLDGAYVETGADGIAKGLAIVRNLSNLRSSQSKSVGILHLSARGLSLFRGWLEDSIMQGRQNDYYDLILGDNMRSNAIKTVDVAGCKWFEVDNQHDLALAEKKFAHRHDESAGQT